MAKSPICLCGHSIKSHLGYDKETSMLWMIYNLGPCRNVECTCHNFRLKSGVHVVSSGA